MCHYSSRIANQLLLKIISGKENQRGPLYWISEQLLNQIWPATNIYQIGYLVALLDFHNFIWFSYIPIYVQNLKLIAWTLTEILSRNINPRWPLGSHIGFRIVSRIKLNLCPGGHIRFFIRFILKNDRLICTNTPAEFQIDCWNTYWDIGHMDAWV